MMICESETNHCDIEDPELEELRRRSLRALTRRFEGTKFLIWLVFTSVIVTLVALDGAPWRIAVVMLASLALGLGKSLLGPTRRRAFEALHRGARTSVPGLLAVLLHWVIVFQAAILFATGGLFSPLVVVMLLPVFVATIADDPHVAIMAFRMEMCALTLFALVQGLGLVQLVPAPLLATEHGPTRFDIATRYVCMVAVLHVVRLLGRGAREASNYQIRALVRARDAALGNIAERTQELTTLSGEIAHELKNPLASVKGLAALIGKGLEGKTAERLSVLRREVDRMQAILDEFLNFSRPLAPLSLRPVSLAVLAREVAELFEGVSGTRRLLVDERLGTTSEVTCDPRKVKQILVNLVQNALDVAPSESAVEITVRASEGRVMVEVLDRGPGLDRSLHGRAFEAGVTTKDTGSGLGLTVARAIARQHDGDLTLEDRLPGPGARALLVLPRAPLRDDPSLGICSSAVAMCFSAAPDEVEER